MEHAHFSISVAGREIDTIYPDLISLEIELDDELAALFRIQIALTLGADGSWTYLDDGTFAPWRPVRVSAGLGDELDELFDGLITHLRPSFDPDPTRCTLEVWGIDRSVQLDREEKLKDWSNKKDSDIAREVLSLYGLSPEVEDTRVLHNVEVATIIQRETDMQFLKRLALRNGYECYVEGATGYFRPPQLSGPPQPALAAHFGPQTTLRSLSLELNALAPTDVTMYQIDRASKEVLEAVVEASRQKSLGASGPADLLGPGVRPARSFIAGSVATSTAEMLALCQGLYHQAEWLVTGEGEVDANDYGYVLRPRRTVTLKGIGETHSGTYYVSHVTHSFTRQGYSQRFRVRRNAIGLRGDERFGDDPGRLL